MFACTGLPTNLFARTSTTATAEHPLQGRPGAQRAGHFVGALSGLGTLVNLCIQLVAHGALESRDRRL